MTFPNIAFKIFILGYIITLVGSIWEKSFILYGILILGFIGVFFLLVLILDKYFNKNHDRKYINKSIFISIISILAGVAMFYMANSSFHMFP